MTAIGAAQFISLLERKEPLPYFCEVYESLTLDETTRGMENLNYLPYALLVRGEFVLRNLPLRSLPAERLEAKAGILIQNCPNIVCVPGTMIAGVNIQIMDCPSMDMLPPETQCGGILVVRNTPLVQLPKGLRCKVLSMKETSVKHIPETAVIEGTIAAYDTNMVYVGTAGEFREIESYWNLMPQYVKKPIMAHREKLAAAVRNNVISYAMFKSILLEAMEDPDWLAIQSKFEAIRRYDPRRTGDASDEAQPHADVLDERADQAIAIKHWPSKLYFMQEKMRKAREAKVLYAKTREDKARLDAEERQARIAARFLEENRALYESWKKELSEVNHRILHLADLEGAGRATDEQLDELHRLRARRDWLEQKIKDIDKGKPPS